MKNKTLETDITKQIVNKINELYITNRQTYLRMNKQGEYSTVTKEKWKDKFVPLHDGLIERHLKGLETIGVFSGKEISKFICFDIDMVDKSRLNWIYPLLMKSLVDIGVHEDYIHVSSSGNKGLHFLLFVEGGTKLSNFKKLFEVTMNSVSEKIDSSIKTKLFNMNELKLEIEDVCNIEFRCTDAQGVKLELGINFKNKDSKTNKCNFLNKNTLKPVKANDYILSIEPMSKDNFLNLMDQVNDVELAIEEDVKLIKKELKEPYSHKINKDENETIHHIVDLINNGLHMSGTRHNSILKIAKYFRYMGMELEECTEELKQWMLKQDKKYYSTPIEEALSECERISRIVYEKEYGLVGHVDNLVIYKSELEQIIKIKNKNDKLLLFSMLIHSKRYAVKSGVFYMTFKQIEEMCGIGDDGAKQSIKRLNSDGFIEVVSRNVRQEKGFKHKPNKYKINIESVDNEIALEIDNTSTTLNLNELYYYSIIKTFNNEELKHLPNRQYNEFTKLRNSVAS